MLKTNELLERLDLIDREMYADMLKQVNIPDFYKCIAQFSGLPISKVSDHAVAEYLTTWAKNKYRFYKMLGNSLRLDQKFKYERQDKNLKGDFELLAKEYPAYYFWLKHFRSSTKNKIENDDLSWQLKDSLNELQFNIIGSSLTHFFKSKLNAPDELVTKLGRLFENDTIEATYTISIHPVDMMLASENPYDWNSCYRLELDRSDSHADGCLASILDTTSLITYVWDNEGEFSLYDQFKFKKIRYYRMRGWIAISEGWEAIHFSGVYPGRQNYDDAFLKQLREIPEALVAKHMKVSNTWRKNAYVQVKDETWTHNRAQVRCYRELYYGYSEFDEDRVYVNNDLLPLPEGVQNVSDFKPLVIKTYNEYITCPCGCGSLLVGSDECVDEYEEGWYYNGEGFMCDNFYQQEAEYKWCPYKDDYCTCGCYDDEECCCDCETYRDNNPVCSLDEEYECEDPDYEMVNNGVMQACEGNCAECWRWQQEQEAMKEEARGEED